MNYKISFIFALIILPFALAETTNTSSSWNFTIATGVTGTTLSYCNATADCGPYACFLDWDLTSGGGYQGWCNATSVTKCYNNGTAYSDTYYECASGTTRRTCSSGAWVTTACSSSCSSGNCTTSAGSSSSSGGSASFTYTLNSSIKLVSFPVDFSITQNESVSKTVQAKNDGNKTLYNVTLKLAGIDNSWFIISPAKFNVSYKDATHTFTINISVPANADVKTYYITINVTASNSSAYAASNFSMKVLPSNKTVETEIVPRLSNYSLLVTVFEGNITALSQKGVDIHAMESILNDIKSRLNEADADIKSQNYFAAKQKLDEAKSLMDSLSSKIATAELPEPPKIDFVFYIVIAVVVAVAGILLYLFWPTK